jgi:hypothetical protein
MAWSEEFKTVWHGSEEFEIVRHGVKSIKLYSME